ncbi:hypothetical protein Dxin01_00744 [Deinococcus xinjiangensis]|uniref:DUF2325 domain-containing protein n=1 Tax=Deinococcus xinjiangensis TaxID=457454 RepID=A0ABP9V6V6_9DEIO
MILPKLLHRHFQHHPLVTELQRDVHRISQKLLGKTTFNTLTEDPTALHDQQRLEITVLCAHALLLGLQLEDDSPEAECCALCLDLAVTLTHHLTTRAARVMPLLILDYIARAAYVTRFGAPLLDEEIMQVAALLVQRAATVHLALPPAWQSGGLADLLRQPTEQVFNQTAGLAELLDLPVDVEHEERAAALRDLYRRTPQAAGQFAALLLLAVAGRGVRSVPTLDLLDDAVWVLLLQKDLEREEQTPPQYAALQEHFKALHAELERPRLPSLRGPQVIAKRERELIVMRAVAALRLLRYQHLGRMHVEALANELMLYSLFERLDAELERGITLPDAPPIKAELIIATLLALSKTHRSPGGHLPVIVELAAQMCGVDPLWGWALNMASPRSAAATLPESVHLLCLALELLRYADVPMWTEVKPLAYRLISRFAGHMFAAARQAGLSFPEHRFLETYFSQFGVLPARTEQHHELLSGHEQLSALLASLVEARQVISEETPPIAAQSQEEGFEGQPVTLDLPPAHVMQAAQLLEGCRVVLIGGQPSPERHAALTTSLKLADLDWLDTELYAHGLHAASHIKPNTDLVILAIRWMGHAHNGLRDVARARGVPCVMHPSGLNPSSVAYQVLQQASEQLRRQNQGGVMLRV